MAIIGIVAVIFGVVAATGDLLLIGLLLVIVVSLAVLAFPDALLWTTVVGGLVIAGLLEIYAPSLKLVRWAFAGASFLLPFSILWRDQHLTSDAPAQTLGRQPTLIYLLAAFLLVCFLSTVLNWHGVGHALYGWKGYFEAWGLLLGLALTRQTPVFFRHAPRLLLAIAFLQLPVVAHQFLVLVPERQGIPGVVPVDIVAGTFGGSTTGGGANSVLALYLLCVIAVLISLWHSGASRARRLPLLAAMLMPPLFLNESKAAMVFLLVAFVLIFREDIRKRPIRFIGYALAMATLLAGLLFSYTMLSDRAVDKDPVYYIEHAVLQNTQEGYRFAGYELNRVTSLKFWAEQRSRYGVAELLLGHGLGESRDQQGVIDLAGDTLASVRYHGMGIGLTSVAGLLWEVGVTGTLIVIAMFFSAFGLAGRLARRTRSAWEHGWFIGLQAVVAMIGLSLLHNQFFLFHFEYQVFVLLILGYLIHSARLPGTASGPSLTSPAS
jgi:hypothetical protein